MHSRTEGNWLLDSYFPPKKGSRTRLVSGENCSPHAHLKATLIIWKHQHQEEKKTRSEVGSWPRCQPQPLWLFLTFILGLLDSYKWIKKKKNCFLSLAWCYSNFRNHSNCWVCGQLPTSNASGLPWWVSPLQGSDWIALRKFILQGRNYISVRATTDITRWDPFTWPIKHAYSDPGHKYEFSLKVARAQ